MDTNRITVQATINADIQKVWECWTQPEHITQWNFASDEWHCPSAFNDLEPGGKFIWRMEARDGSMGFDYKGVYVEIFDQESITKRLDDGRQVSLKFINKNEVTEVIESFEPESENEIELQRLGWQAILNNFKKYVESNV